MGYLNSSPDGYYVANTYATTVDSSSVNINVEDLMSELNRIKSRVSMLEDDIDSSCSDIYDLSYGLDDLRRKVEAKKNGTEEKIIDKKSKLGDSNSMNFNFDFGPCDHTKIALSMYGLAVKNTSGTWVAYNKDKQEIVDVDILHFNSKNMFYKIPVAISDIKPGDIIVHSRVPMFVKDVKDGVIDAVDPVAGEYKTVMLTKSPFGFNFATKVVSMFDSFTGTPDENNPFGNMLPFFLMKDGNDLDPMVMMLMAQNGGSFDMNNPMMLYFLMDSKGNDNILPLMLMMNQGKGN